MEGWTGQNISMINELLGKFATTGNSKIPEEIQNQIYQELRRIPDALMPLRKLQMTYDQKNSE
jgi:hypothetical protein